MRKLLVAAGVAGASVAIGIGAGTASAAQPVVQGCVGESVSALAKTLHPYGQVVLDPNAPRNDFGTIGDAVQAFHAGQIPDEVLPNTCN
jgi:hypothetical protein